MQSADDGGLNPLGHQQAEQLAARLEPNGPLPIPTILIASPKRRARQTLHPIAYQLGLAVVVQKALDERRNSETLKEFHDRIRAWAETMEKELATDDVVWAVTHMDWLEEAMVVLPTDLGEIELSSGFAPAESQGFEIVDGIWQGRKRIRI